MFGKEVSSLPVRRSTLVSFSGQLLAVGGWYDSLNWIHSVYGFDFYTDLWNVIKNKQSQCIAARGRVWLTRL